MGQSPKEICTKLLEDQDVVASEGHFLSPTEGLGGITVGDLVAGWVKSLAGEQHDTRQSHRSLLSSMLTSKMRQRTVAIWQNPCEVKQKCLSQGRLKQALDFMAIMVLSLGIRIRQKT